MMVCFLMEDVEGCHDEDLPSVRFAGTVTLQLDCTCLRYLNLAASHPSFGCG